MHRPSHQEMLGRLVLRPLVDLGAAAGPDLAGIWSPGYTDDALQRFMSDHYASVKGARAQAETLDLTGYYKVALSEAFDRIGGGPRGAAPIVLEVGCGSGAPRFHCFSSSRTLE
jgi:hypothetical protein